MLATYTVIDEGQQADVVELDGINVQNEQDETVKLEMKASTLKRLLEKRQVCASDFHCLDCSTRQCMRMLCLQTCLKSANVQSI